VWDHLPFSNRDQIGIALLLVPITIMVGNRVSLYGRQLGSWQSFARKVRFGGDLIRDSKSQLTRSQLSSTSGDLAAIPLLTLTTRTAKTAAPVI